jgi:hypothetical protein
VRHALALWGVSWSRHPKVALLVNDRAVNADRRDAVGEKDYVAVPDSCSVVVFYGFHGLRSRIIPSMSLPALVPVDSRRFCSLAIAGSLRRTVRLFRGLPGFLPAFGRLPPCWAGFMVKERRGCNPAGWVD